MRFEFDQLSTQIKNYSSLYRCYILVCGFRDLLINFCKKYPRNQRTFFLATENNDFTVVYDQMVHNYPSFHIAGTLFILNIH